MIPTLIGVAVLVFFMLRVIPGDGVEVKRRGDGGNVSQEMIDSERHRLGLDKPLVYQFKDWMVGLVTLDLGTSMWTDRPVTEEIALRLELSLQVRSDSASTSRSSISSRTGWWDWSRLTSAHRCGPTGP